MLGEPTLTHRPEGGRDIPLLVWRLPGPVRAISSAVLGGGIGECRWLINATVPMSYDRDDPAVHLTEMARHLNLTGPGVGLLTGVDVADMVTESERGIRLWATVGLGAPIQAGDPASPMPSDPASPPPSDPASPPPSDPASPPPSDRTGPAPGRSGSFTKPGTVNIVAWIPERLSDGALVNAIATVTEAKTRAIRDLGLNATGTATDAVCVLCPLEGPAVAYGGPLSRWGEPLARAAHRAVLAGGKTNLAGIPSWSERSARPDRAPGPVQVL